jgi:hypothetical protein
MGPVLQKRAMAVFHYALKPTGFLLISLLDGVKLENPDNFYILERIEILEYSYFELPKRADS